MSEKTMFQRYTLSPLIVNIHFSDHGAVKIKHQQ